MQRELVIGGFYRHFKNKLYQVRGVAIHSETKEKMVVYQGLYGSYELYVRPYDMFLSEVDHNKYPDVEQKYRFELIDINTGKALEKSDDTSAYNKSIDNVNMVSADNTYTVDKSACDIAGNRYTENKSIDYKTENVSSDNGNIADTYNSDENTVQDSKLIRFLDAYDYKEKLDILTSMRSELNDGLIDIMAESIDVAVPEGDITDRYNSLRKCLLAHTKYEGLRLRQ